VPAHPSTRADLDHIRKIERNLDIPSLVKQGLARAELTEYRFPSSDP
jgi:hypothetical protein